VSLVVRTFLIFVTNLRRITNETTEWWGPEAGARNGAPMADRYVDPIEEPKSCATCKWRCLNHEWHICAVEGELKDWQPKPIRKEMTEEKRCDNCKYQEIHSKDCMRNSYDCFTFDDEYVLWEPKAPRFPDQLAADSVSACEPLELPQKVKSDGSTASYYELPEGATELQDLISYKNMNAQMGEILRACYRYGQVEHSEKMRDAKKIKFYIEAEIDRLEKYGE